jgi:hypothetical protein
MTTHLEADNMYLDRGDLSVYHTKEIISGTESFNTTRQVTLLTPIEHDSHPIYLHVNNHPDHASVIVDLEQKPKVIPELHAAVNGEPVEISLFDKVWKGLIVQEGQTFEIWFGSGKTYEERDQHYGAARAVWKKPDVSSENA